MLGAQHITYVLPQIELTPFQLTPLGTLLGALCKCCMLSHYNIWLS